MSRKDVIIYDAINCAKDWQNDMVSKWMRQCDKNGNDEVEVRVIAREGESKLIIDSMLNTMISRYGTLSFNTIKSDADATVMIGWFMHHWFKSGYNPGSTIYFNSSDNSVLAAAELVTLLANEEILKPEDRLRIVLGKISLLSSGYVFNTKNRTILGGNQEEG